MCRKAPGLPKRRAWKKAKAEAKELQHLPQLLLPQLPSSKGLKKGQPLCLKTGLANLLGTPLCRKPEAKEAEKQGRLKEPIPQESKRGGNKAWKKVIPQTRTNPCVREAENGEWLKKGRKRWWRRNRIWCLKESNCLKKELPSWRRRQLGWGSNLWAPAQAGEVWCSGLFFRRRAWKKAKTEEKPQSGQQRQQGGGRRARGGEGRRGGEGVVLLELHLLWGSKRGGSEGESQAKGGGHFEEEGKPTKGEEESQGGAGEGKEKGKRWGGGGEGGAAGRGDQGGQGGGQRRTEGGWWGSVKGSWKSQAWKKAKCLQKFGLLNGLKESQWHFNRSVSPGSGLKESLPEQRTP